MTRPPRFDAPGQWHHVMNRGAGRRTVFGDDEERWWFLEELARIDSSFGVEVHAFCLMGNHYHLVLRSRDGRLSEAMKWVGQRFTQRVNARRKVDGSIFRGRFHSVVVNRDAHLDWLFHYVNANPTDLGWEGRLADYPWSSLGQQTGRRNDLAWCRSDFVSERFGDARRFERFVDDVTAGRPGSLHRCEPPTWSDVEAATKIARASGPHSHSDADVRAVTLMVGREQGLGWEGHIAVESIPAKQRNVVVRRAEARVNSYAPLTVYVDQARIVLRVDGFGPFPPAFAHSA